MSEGDHLPPKARTVSPELRDRAIALSKEIGPTATAIQLGVTAAQVRRWRYRRGVTGSSRGFSQADRSAVCGYASETSPREAAEKYGLHHNTVRLWRKLASAEKEVADIANPLEGIREHGERWSVEAMEVVAGVFREYGVHRTAAILGVSHATVYTILRRARPLNVGPLSETPAVLPEHSRTPT